MNSPLAKLIVRWLVLALGVTLAEKLIPGIDCRDGATLLVVVVLLSFFNAVLRPILVLFTLPFIVLTLGLGLVVLNALLFLLVGEIVQGFVVDGFWSAVGGAVIVGVTNLVMTILMRSSGGGGPGGGLSGNIKVSVNRGPRPSEGPAQTGGGGEKLPPGGKGDVIDV